MVIRVCFIWNDNFETSIL